MVLDDYGFAGTIAEAFGVRYTGYQLYDTTYVPELDYNFVWMCVQATPCGMNGTVLDATNRLRARPLERQPRGRRTPMCSILDGQTMASRRRGLCAPTTGPAGEIQYNATYQVLLNDITALELIPGSHRRPARCLSSGSHQQRSNRRRERRR